MTERTVNITETVVALFQGKKYATLRDILGTLTPPDIAIVLTEMPREALPVLFRLLSKETAADTFVEMDTDIQKMLVDGFSDSELKAVIDELYIDDAVDIIEEMPANVVTRMLLQADSETRRMINEVLKYPDDSAGSLMTPEYVNLSPKMTVAEAIEHVRRTGVDKETVDTCYVTDGRRKLIGVIPIRTLIMSREGTLVSDVMEENVISVTTLADKESVARMFAKYGFIALPVVDGEDRLVGIVTVDDAIDVLTEEATEDVEIMAAIVPTEKPYLKLSTWEIWKSRFPWLALLTVSATFTGIIITFFENALAANAILTSFIPMLMGTGGNSGGQASVTVIRGISLDEIKFRDIFRVVWKEFRVSILCGIALSVVTFLKIWLIDYLVMGSDISMAIALAVSISMALTVIIAKFMGCTLPLLAKKIGFDPAVMASPLITTIVDAVALLIYFAMVIALVGV